MKKGCFISVLIILTFITAAIIYIVKYKKDDLASFFKPYIISSAANEIRSKIENFDSTNKDSLLKIVDEFSSKVENKEKVNFAKLERFFDEAKHILNDGQIDSLELKSLKKIVSEY